MVAKARQYEDQPVLFVAVNSGTSSSSVQRYLSGVNCPWPAIVDQDRSFERACGLDQISLQNIWQTRIITSDGQLKHGDMDSLGRYLKSARWQIDPTGIPDSLKEAWRALEFDMISQACSLLGNSTRTRDAHEMAAYKKLHGEIETIFSSRMQVARTFVAENRLGEANLAFQQVLNDFSGFDEKRLAEVTDGLDKVTSGLLKEVWQGLEQGGAAPFRRLEEVIDDLLSSRLAAAHTLAEENRLWEASRAYQKILDDFDGFGKSRLSGALSALRELMKNDTVRTETRAMKALAAARGRLDSSSARKRKMGRAELKRLIEKYPGTEATRTAKALLQSNG